MLTLQFMFIYRSVRSEGKGSSTEWMCDMRNSPADRGFSSNATRRLARFLSLSAAGLALAPGLAQAQDAPVVLDTVTIEAAGGEADGMLGGAIAGAAGADYAVDGYVADTTASATKTDLPIVRVPQMVAVITEEQLDDRNVQSLTEALTYSASARVGAFGLDPRFDSFYIRGFDATYTGVFRDGLRDFSNSFLLSQVEPYGLQSLSVLKGPSSGLYGSANAGGIIDLTSKRPTTESFREIGAEYGTNNRYQATFDASGPLGGSGSTFYRMTGVARDSDTDNPFVSDDELLIAPAITYAPDADTSFTVLSELQRVHTGGTAAYVQGNRDVTDVPYADPNFNDLDQTQGRIGYEFEQRLSDVFTFRQKARYQGMDIYGEYLYPYGAAVNGVLARGSGVVAQTLHGGVADTQLEAKFDTGILRHTMTGGIDGYYTEFTNKEGYGTAPSLNLASLDYSRGIDRPDYTVAEEQSQRQLGLYLQDIIEIDRLTVALGARHDWVKTETATGAPGNLGEAEDQSDDAFTGRVGVSYLFDNGIAPYASYSTSFSPNIGLNPDGSAFVPTTAEQYELGVKYQVPDVNLLVSAAIYQIEQEKGVFLQPSADFSTSVQVQLDKLRSRGFEIEAAAGLADGLNLTLSYAYLDMEIIEGVPGTEGNTLSSRPQHTAAAYLDYTVQNGFAKGFGIGGGVRFVGESFGNDRNSFKNDARAYVDAALHYDVQAVEGLRVQVNATNIFDEDAALCTEGFCYAEQERQVIGSVRYRF